MPETIMVTGHAQMPKGASSGDNQAVFTLELLVKRADGEILDADFWGSTPLSRGFLVSLAQGYCLTDGVDGLLHRVRRSLLSPTQGAMQQALRAAYERWRSGKAERVDEGSLAQLWK